MVGDHPVLLRGLSWDGLLAGPRINERIDQNFVPALLDALTTENGQRDVVRNAPQTRDANNRLRLYQPVHHTFNIALVEAVCAPFDFPQAQPRLDPARIESAGLVVRRRSDGDRREGWLRGGSAMLGWQAFAAGEEELDPDPARRAAEPGALVPTGDRSERVSPLFVAPPAVCCAAGKTVLYGLIPTASPEFSETAANEPVDPGWFRDEHLAPLLRARAQPYGLPYGGAMMAPAHADPPDEDNSDPSNRRRAYAALVRQLHLEFGAFGDTAEGQALLTQLNRLSVKMVDGSTVPAGPELSKAARVLVEGDTKTTVAWPAEWPAIDASTATAIATAAQAALTARLALVRPRQGRFDDHGSQYVARAFIRVKRQDNCPPRLIWSAETEPFQIAPWYESNEAADIPPARVALPNLFKPKSFELDKEALKKLKPNVAFEVPESLFNFLQGANLKDLTNGKSPSRGGLAVDWICAFSIPLITLCAFIVLNLFLVLFNFIFQWLLYIKICIPIPKRSSS